MYQQPQDMAYLLGGPGYPPAGAAPYPAPSGDFSVFPGGVAAVPPYQHQPNFAGGMAPAPPQPPPPQPQTATYAPPAVVGVAQQKTPPESVDEGDPDLRFERGVLKERVSARAIYEIDRFDPGCRQVIKSMQSPVTDASLKATTAIGIVQLFNAVVTVMLIASTFERGINAEVRDRVPEATRDAVVWIMKLAPLAFFLLQHQIVNNYFSVRLFYAYLTRGMLVDYPNTQGPRALVTSARPLLFIIFWTVYFVFCLAFMGAWGASLGTVVTFVSNMAVGIFLWWYRQQGVEAGLVSLPKFIESFPDKKGDHGCGMDECTLGSSVFWLKDVVLIRSDKPSYTTAARDAWWNLSTPSTASRLFHHGLNWGVVALCIGLCAYYFTTQDASAVAEVWKQEQASCFQACVVVTNATISGGYSGVVPAPFCSGCLCQCLQRFERANTQYLDRCEKDFSVPARIQSLCGTSAGPLCSAVTNNCTDS